MSTLPGGVYAKDLTDTAGALHILEQRSGQRFSPDTLHYHVRAGNLSAYVFINGELVRWQAEEQRRGQTFIFLKGDVYGLPIDPKKRGRKPKNQFLTTSENQPKTP